MKLIKIWEDKTRETPMWCVEAQARFLDDLVDLDTVTLWLRQERITFRIRNFNTLEFDDETGATLFYLRYAI